MAPYWMASSTCFSVEVTLPVLVVSTTQLSHSYRASSKHHAPLWVP